MTLSLPPQHSASDYGLDKPIVIGEFLEENGGGMKVSAKCNVLSIYLIVCLAVWMYVSDTNPQGLCSRSSFTYNPVIVNELATWRCSYGDKTCYRVALKLLETMSCICLDFKGQ